MEISFGTIWNAVAVVTFLVGFVIMLQKFKVAFLDGEFDLGTVMFFSSIVMLVLGVFLLGGKKD
jgi:lipopolysaccharide export LptBFGC system permease protein LptF